MKAKVYSTDGTQIKEKQLPDEMFERECSLMLIAQVVEGYRSNIRQGTSKTKTRAEVSGGTSKPWRQKGTGRARAGSNTSPIWVRGGKAFGAKARDYSTKIPRKMRNKALAALLSDRAKEEKVLIVDTLTCESPRTSVVDNMLKALNISGQKTLLVTNGDANVYLSARNIKNVHSRPVKELTAYDVISSDNVVFCSEELIDTLKEKVVRS